VHLFVGQSDLELTGVVLDDWLGRRVRVREALVNNWMAAYCEGHYVIGLSLLLLRRHVVECL